MSVATPSPRVYVGTYHKYNCGSLNGAWLDLDSYSDWDEFHEACLELHSDEEDPELMFQDYEGFPESFYCESSINADLWDWISMDDSDKELLSVYVEHVNQNGDLKSARDAFLGTYEREIDYAYECTESLLQEASELCRQYFDHESYLHDLKCNGLNVVYHNGEFWIFS